MARDLPPFVYWLKGKPRFIPGPRERALGYAPESLRHRNGDWFSFEQAHAWGVDRCSEIERARGIGHKPATPRSPRGRTIGDLLDDWIESDDFAALDSDKSKDSYRSMARAIKFTPQSAGKPEQTRDREPFSLAPVSATGRRQIKKFVLAGMKVRGHHMALGMKAALSAAFSWGMDDDKWALDANPCLRLKLRRPKKQMPVIWSVPEWLAARAFGDHPAVIAELPHAAAMVDAIELAVWSGQRPEDVIYFEGGALVDVLDPATGRTVPTLRFTQSKTGKVMSVPPSSFLKARLLAIAARLKALRYNGARLIVEYRRAHPATRDHVRRTQGAAAAAALPITPHDYEADTFRDHFAAFVEAVGRGRPDLGLPPCPSIAGKRLKHLRKAHTTWSKASGNDLAGIASVTGHELQSLNVIGQHYLFLGEGEAAVAIAKLEAWLTLQLGTMKEAQG